MKASMKLPWTRILAEGAVIVAGILIALAADAWWDERVERREERSALEELLAEFEDNAAQLDSVLSHHRTGYEAATALLAFARGQTQLSPDSIRTLIWVLDNPWTFNPKSGALTALIATGRLGILRDDALRVDLAGWDGLLEDYREDEAGSRAFVLGPQYAYFSSVVNWGDFYEREDGPAPPTLVRLADDPRLEGVVSYRASFLRGVLEEAQYLVEALERIRQGLAGNLGKATG